jgi:phospholipid/cholesterol/gamma-HCH transport system substrate-binding protein
MKHNFFETIVGFVILLITISFFLFAKDKANIENNGNTYNLTARFDKIDGINPGSDIRIAGVKIGTVLSYALDIETYEAIAIFNIKENIKIPTDSIASVVSSGLLGKKYITIEPGAEDLYLNDKEELIYTQSSLNIESLIGKFMFKDK